MAGTVSKFETQADTVAEKLSKVVIPDEVLKTDVVTVLKVLAASVGKFTERAEALSNEQGERTDKLSESMLKIAAFQSGILEKLEKQAQQEANTRQLLVRLLESNTPNAPVEVPSVKPVWPVAPSAESPSVFVPISETSSQPVAPNGASLSGFNGSDEPQSSVQAPEPVAERTKPRWWR
jgi:hypothetical protein